MVGQRYETFADWTSEIVCKDEDVSQIHVEVDCDRVIFYLKGDPDTEVGDYDYMEVLKATLRFLGFASVKIA